MATILVVDDNAALREQYRYDLARVGGFDVLTADGGHEGLAKIEEEVIDCVVLDLEMPDLDGFSVLDALARKGSRVPVLVYTGTGDFERCVRAVQAGAFAFIDKAEPVERVVREIMNALRTSRLQDEVETLRRKIGAGSSLIGESAAMKSLRGHIGKLAGIPSSVLISGESGTGKELVARELHEQSGRKGPFLAVNCAALPDNLVESELFGHEKGAFTGADRRRIGAFESAQKGTLFLDEIGELPGPVQAKLLRVLQEEKLQRVGSHSDIDLDVRVLAATNRDLKAEVSEDRFREDLYYRIAVHRIDVPPLRDRLSDLPLLVRHLADSVYERFGMSPQEMSPAAMARLSRHSWSGNNVRELRNVVERMILEAGSGTIEDIHVPEDVGHDAELLDAQGDGVDSAGAATDAGELSRILTEGTLKQRRAAAEKAILLRALADHDWHITRTAAALGLADHSSLLKIMRRHGIRK